MSNPTVLIIEDEFAIADLLEMALTDEGYRVVRAANGRQGLERLAEEPRPDLVITDFMMPILDGASFLQAMRNTETPREIPSIVISSMPEANVRARIDGYAAFVRKPFQLTEVVRLVAAILSVPQQAPAGTFPITEGGIPSGSEEENSA
jgi:CheY-like chemotaxis protein